MSRLFETWFADERGSARRQIVYKYEYDSINSHVDNIGESYFSIINETFVCWAQAQAEIFILIFVSIRKEIWNINDSLYLQ